MPGMGRGFGITAAVPHEIAAELAVEVERLGYTSFWVNDMGQAEGLASLAVGRGGDQPHNDRRRRHPDGHPPADRHCSAAASARCPAPPARTRGRERQQQDHARPRAQRSSCLEGRGRRDGRGRRARSEDVGARRRGRGWGAVQLDDTGAHRPPRANCARLAHGLRALRVAARSRSAAVSGARALLGASPIRAAPGAHERDSARHVCGRRRTRRRCSAVSPVSRPCSTRRSSGRSQPTTRSTASSSSPARPHRRDAALVTEQLLPAETDAAIAARRTP